MKKLLLLLPLLLSATCFAQVQVVAPIASSGRSSASPGVSNIENITITVNPAQYIGTKPAPREIRK
jgi:hypothetical protein